MWIVACQHQPIFQSKIIYPVHIFSLVYCKISGNDYDYSLSKDNTLKLQQLILLFISLIWFQACSVSGPVHSYPGEKRPASETARLLTPGPITITKIDGKEVDVPSQDDGMYEIFLLPGLHRIEFKYDVYWGDTTSGMVITSDEVGIETPFHAAKTYKLTYPEPDDLEAAFAMAEKFKARLIEQETGRIVLSRSLAELNERGVQTSLVYSKRDVDQANHSQPNNQPLAKSAQIKPPAGIDVNTATREDAVKRLKFWWLMANEEERKLFRSWTDSLQDSEKKTP